VGEREKVSGEGDGAEEGEEIAESDGGEEIGEGGSGGCGEEEEAGEGEKGSEVCRCAWGVSAGGTDRRDSGKEWDEDDDESGDEGRFGGGGASESGGLELIADGEEEADDGSGGEGGAGDGAEVAAVDDGERDGRERHAQEIEEEWRGVAEGVFDEDEGGSPDGDDCEEQEMGEGGWA
jgi:hypothetical protein